MSKILCERMKGRQLNTAFGQFNFDQQGIAEVPDEYANKLLALNGYKLVGGNPAEPEKEDTQENAPDAQNAAEGSQVDKTSKEEENGQDDDESGAEQAGEDVQEMKSSLFRMVRKIPNKNLRKAASPQLQWSI